jgi:hypothetical protein
LDIILGNINNRWHGRIINMVDILTTLVSFFASWLVSTVIIYIVTKIFGEKEGIGTAVLAALAGAVVYTIIYFLLGGIVAAVIGGFAWLFVLGKMYKMGWLKSLVIAVIIWLLASMAGMFLPTFAGPL